MKILLFAMALTFVPVSTFAQKCRPVNDDYSCPAPSVDDDTSDVSEHKGLKNDFSDSGNNASYKQTVVDDKGASKSSSEEADKYRWIDEIGNKHEVVKSVEKVTNPEGRQWTVITERK